MERNIFREAIGVLKTKGWTKGQYQTYDGCCCLVGACAEAAGSESPGDFERTDAHQFLENMLYKTYARRSITNWNDNQASVDPVIALLEKTADAWDAR